MSAFDTLDLSDAQRAALAELVISEQRHASHWWTHLNEMRWCTQLPEWASDAGPGGRDDYDLWCESRKALNQAHFGSDDLGTDRPRLEVEV